MDAFTADIATLAEQLASDHAADPDVRRGGGASPEDESEFEDHILARALRETGHDDTDATIAQLRLALRRALAAIADRESASPDVGDAITAYVDGDDHSREYAVAWVGTADCDGGRVPAVLATRHGRDYALVRIGGTWQSPARCRDWETVDGDAVEGEDAARIAAVLGGREVQ